MGDKKPLLSRYFRRSCAHDISASRCFPAPRFPTLPFGSSGMLGRKRRWTTELAADYADTFFAEGGCTSSEEARKPRPCLPPISVEVLHPRVIARAKDSNLRSSPGLPEPNEALPTGGRTIEERSRYVLFPAPRSKTQSGDDSHIISERYSKGADPNEALTPHR